MSRNPIYIKLINSARWKKLRVQKLKANPVCEECAKRDVSTLATEIHHVTPVESVVGVAAMARLMFNWMNLQSLCHACMLTYTNERSATLKKQFRITTNEQHSVLQISS